MFVFYIFQSASQTMVSKMWEREDKQVLKRFISCCDLKDMRQAEIDCLLCVWAHDWAIEISYLNWIFSYI